MAKLKGKFDASIAQKQRNPNSEATVDLLPFEPLATFRPGPLQDDALLADNHGKKIGILILTYNAVGTLTKVLKRITPMSGRMSPRLPSSTTPARTPPMNWRWG